MNELDLHWLAGLLEGEGCFFASRAQRNKGYRIAVKLSMTDKDVMERAQRIMQVKSLNVHSRPNKKVAYIISLEGNHARNLMWTLLPLMGSRRQDTILTNLAHWYEVQMAICGKCDREFSRSGQRFSYCPTCRVPKRGGPVVVAS